MAELISVEPRAGRPYMPGYGVPKSLDGSLPWRWALERLKASRNYWLSSTRADGRPHTMAVWGAMVNNYLFFSTADGSAKARNLDRDPRCTVCTERADESVVVEGVAERASNRTLIERFALAYSTKYDYPLDVDAPPGPIWLVRPQKVFGFIEAESRFSTTATCWTFGELA